MRTVVLACPPAHAFAVFSHSIQNGELYTQESRTVLSFISVAEGSLIHLRNLQDASN